MEPKFGAKEVMMSRKDEHRTSLRIDGGTYRRIDRIRKRDGRKVTMSEWLERAIDEKLDRDEVREEAATYGAERQAKSSPEFRFYEFFAGGGMARAGLGDRWECLLANDFDPMKASAYRDNWDGGRELVVGDINWLAAESLPTPAHLAWASFPCQDLSLAGKYEGLGTSEDAVRTRSGTFWAFVRLMKEQKSRHVHPELIVLENVYGILTSNGGNDFRAVCEAVSSLGYRYGALVLDGRHFVPQSRPRVFIVGVRKDLAVPRKLLGKGPMSPWHPERLIAAFNTLQKDHQTPWIWWNLPRPDTREVNFIDLIEDEPSGVEWHTPIETKKLIAMMSDTHLEKLREAKDSGKRTVGAVYKRTRHNERGEKVQRAEIRFDSIAGCLRTPAGGSSRQIIVLVEGSHVRSRLLSPREAARLMGLPDTYKLPRNYNDAYHVAGDGVVVPAVRHLSKNILERILEDNPQEVRIAPHSPTASSSSAKPKRLR